MTVIPWIKKQYPEVATRKNVVPAVLAALRHMPVMKKQHRQALAIWLRASKELEAQQQARRQKRTSLLPDKSGAMSTSEM
ncbi:hypothetical protein ABBQ32_012856 [Trebouxia sp. C0010 RCD-2024]